MRMIGCMVFAGALVAAGLALWSSSNTLAKQSEASAPFTAPVRTMSAQEIHRSTNLMNLPVQPKSEEAI